jgi:predicted transposase/invertase (TIGR01784 family)
MSKKLIRFDWAVKKLLRNKANFVILEGFLSELLFDDIRIEKILESEGNQETEDDKFNRVDILTQNSKNELIVVEIQNTFEIDFFHRMAYGASKALTENLSLGQAYSEIKKVISINIVYFDLGQGQDYVYRGSTNFYGLHQNDTLTLSDKQKTAFSKDKVSDIFPEFYIIKVNKFNDIAKDTLDEWVYFLKNSEVKDEFKAKGLKEAGEVLDYMRLPQDDQFSYNRYLDYLHYKASEVISLQSEEEDRVRLDERNIRNITIATKSILKGFDNQTISDLTDMTVEQIEEVRTEIRQKSTTANMGLWQAGGTDGSN